MREQIQKSQIIYSGRASRLLRNFWCMSNMLATFVCSVQRQGQQIAPNQCFSKCEALPSDFRSGSLVKRKTSRTLLGATDFLKGYQSQVLLIKFHLETHGTYSNAGRKCCHRINWTKPRAPFRVGCSANRGATFDAFHGHQLPNLVSFRFKNFPLPLLYSCNWQS